ncbi:MAG: RelA/SpoT family protein, partial [Acidimicrobiales bacterium]
MVSLTSRAPADPALVNSVERLVQRYLGYHAEGDEDLIRRAGLAAIAAHEGQLRRTGEPYVTHPIAVADIVADLGLDATTIAAALLHDAVEDTGVTTAWLGAEFGDHVAAVVDGVTKLDRLEFDSKEAQQAATIRKMFIAMVQDWRVLLIKLADRLHNLRTISVMPMARQRAIAQESLDVYAPLAHRLGVQQVKWQLEDLSFATLHPKRYAEIEQMVAARAPERDTYVAEVMETLAAKLDEFSIKAEVRGRPKHLWSIYEKMVIGGKEFDEIFDLVGLRVVVEDERDCWAVLGAIHALWSPVQGRFKDYINSPKFNFYQSLHTTVIGPRGKSVEVQIRTFEMHRRAEFGVAAHWGYKEGASNKEVAWMQRLADVEEEEN